MQPGMEWVGNNPCIPLAGRYSEKMKLFRSLFIYIVLAIATTFMLFGGKAHALAGNPYPENVGMVTQTASTVTVTSTQMLPQNMNRNVLILQNQSASVVTIKFGSVQVGSEGIQILGNTILTLSPAFTDSIWAKSAAGSPTVEVIEGIK